MPLRKRHVSLGRPSKGSDRVPGEDLGALLMGLLAASVQLAAFALTVVLVIANRRTFRAYWKTGLLLGLVAFVLLLPSVVMSIAHFDTDAFLEGTRPSAPRGFMEAAVLVGLVVGGAIAVLRIGWHMLVYTAAAAEWGRLGPGSFPVLQRSGSTPWKPIIGAAAFGLAAGTLSVFVFEALGVEESEVLRRALSKMFPGLESADVAVMFPVVLLWAVAAALTEELTYRGVVSGFLLRLRPGDRAMEAVASVVSSLLWALLHLQNTDSPFLKCVQIFVLGLVFFELAKRWCIEAAIAAHVGLNVAAVVVGLALY